MRHTRRSPTALAHARPHSTKFKIVFTSGQIASLLSDSYDVALPASFLEYTKVLGFMQLDFVGVLPIACNVACCRARRLCELRVRRAKSLLPGQRSTTSWTC